MSIFDHSDDCGHDFVFICPSNLECVLAAGDANDLDALRQWCQALPRKSYGRVFIEVDSQAEIEPFETPQGVGVTWIERKAGDAAGTALTGAVDGWLDEWLRGDPLSGRTVRLWAGACRTLTMVGYWARIETELAEMWAAALEYREQLA